jgi:hypothetical protein
MATTAGFKRVLAASVLAVAVVSATATPARAQGSWMPLLPDQDFYDFQMFAPPDLNSYSIYQDPSEGIFFNYDRLYLGITVPNVVPVGNTEFFPVEPLNPNVAQQLNTANGGFAGVVIYGTDQFNLSLDTSWMRTKMSWGNRYEGGWIYDNHGMMFSYWDSGPQGQEFTTINEYAINTPVQEFSQVTETGNATVGGVATPLVTTTITSTSPPPDHVVSQYFRQANETRIQSGGAAWIIRRELGRRGSGSSVRFGFGPRFIQLADRYALSYQSYQYDFNTSPGGDIDVDVDQQFGGDVNTITPGGVSLTGLTGGSQLQNGDWETYAANNIAGPEFSLHFESTKGRWTVLSDFKFTGGFNWQNMIYRGSNFPASLSADYFRSTFTTADVFTADGTAQTNVVGSPLYVQVFGLGQRNGTNIAEHQFTFTPIGEWRLGTEFRVSQALLLRAGYTGMWMGQIARASANTAYVTELDNVQRSVPNPAYDPTQPVSPTNAPTLVATVPVEYTRIAPPPGGAIQDYVFTNGIDFGVEIKY